GVCVGGFALAVGGARRRVAGVWAPPAGMAARAGGPRRDDREERDGRQRPPKPAAHRHAAPTRQCAARLPPPSRTREPRMSIPAPPLPRATLSAMVASCARPCTPAPWLPVATAASRLPPASRARMPPRPLAVATARTTS